jgi:hypothetical protein
MDYSYSNRVDISIKISNSITDEASRVLYKS